MVLDRFVQRLGVVSFQRKMRMPPVGPALALPQDRGRLPCLFQQVLPAWGLLGAHSEAASERI
eukprot:1761932-Pyramimonas_sp.AAC.1